MKDKYRDGSMFDGARSASLGTEQYKTCQAFLIAINNYVYLGEEYQLSYPEADASRLAAILKANFGFKTDLVLGKAATRQGIEQVLTALSTSTSRKDGVFVFYSGHGMEFDGNGYVIPHDGKSDQPNTWIAAQWFTDVFRSIPARHVFLVGDMCHAGAFLKNYFASKESHKEKNVQFLLSSAVSQQAPDRSIFADALCKGLMGQAGDKEEGVIYASELMYFVEAEVERLSSNQDVIGDSIILNTYTGEEFSFQWKIPVLPSKVLRDLNNRFPEVRIAAIRQMAGHKTTPGLTNVILEELSGTIFSDRDIDVRREAIGALGKLHHPKSLGMLAEILSSHKPMDIDEDTQDPLLFTVTGAMEELKNPKAIIHLTQFLSENKHSKISGMLARMAISNLATCVQPDDKDVIDCVASLAMNPHVEHQDTFISNLKQIGGNIAMNALLAIAQNNESPDESKRAALFSLASIGNLEILGALEKWNVSDDIGFLKNDRQDVIKALRKRFGIIEWDENELMYDDGIVIPDFASPVLQSALGLDGCPRVSTLLELVRNRDAVPVGDRQLAAISLMANESNQCNDETLLEIVRRLKETLENESNKNIAQNLTNTLELFLKEVERRNISPV